MVGRAYNPALYRFGFNGKEDDNEVEGQGNEYNYGFRIYNPRLGRFLSVDPLQKKFPFYSPYHFAGNDVMRNTDLDGREPKSVVAFNPVTGNYRFTAPVIHLLSLVSGVSEERISQANLKKNSDVIVANKQGALTTVDRIAYTNEYFNASKDQKENFAYGQDNLTAVYNWLDISSHEVGHLPQADKYGKTNAGKITYLLSFGKDYIAGYLKYKDMNQAHNNTPREQEAEKGTTEFEAFNEFANKEFGDNAVAKLLMNNKLTDKQKVEKIDTYWKAYQDNKNKKSPKSNDKNNKKN